MLALGGLLIAPLAYVYSQLAAAMPRSGGEYVFLRSRRLPGADQGPISGGYTAVSVASLAVMLSAGPLLYLGSRYVRRRQGIDIALAMRELPPE